MDVDRRWEIFFISIPEQELEVPISIFLNQWFLIIHLIQHTHFVLVIFRLLHNPIVMLYTFVTFDSLTFWFFAYTFLSWFEGYLRLVWVMLFEDLLLLVLFLLLLLWLYYSLCLVIYCWFLIVLCLFFTDFRRVCSVCYPICTCYSILLILLS